MYEKNTNLITGWNLDNSYARLPDVFFSRLHPTPVRAPGLIIINEGLAASLGLDAAMLQSQDGTAVLAGNMLPEGSIPIAQAYAGHQFGHFTMLGDGRALLLGEQITPQGQRLDIQLKGSGKTPYSRGGDGRAALGPMLREYIISEAMHGLGIATTRSLAVVTTGESVIRETVLPGAILTRVASSHIRVGTFEYIAQWGTLDELTTLADYTVKRHFPEAAADENCYLALLREVIKRQAGLIAQWQLVGFIHGVMNTDNMTISGETIDYGPCAFMDTYNPATVFSSIDMHGRYAYGNQPTIAAWNLARFAETLLPLLHEDRKLSVQLAQDLISEFSRLYQCNWLTGMRAKLGLMNEETGDEILINDLLAMMHKHQADFTNTFRALPSGTLPNTTWFSSPEFIDWHKSWQARLDRQAVPRESAYHLMRSCNPAVIPRNHRVEEALKAAADHGDYRPMRQLLDILALPYEDTLQPGDYYTAPLQSAIPYRTFCGT